MSFNVSLLNATFVALLGILAFARLVWPQRYQLEVFDAFGKQFSRCRGRA